MPSGLENEFKTQHEFVKAARIRLDAALWDYLVGGSETETTLRRNRLALDSIAFRPRILRDVSQIDASSTFLGKRVRLPVLIAPVGGLPSFEPGGGVISVNTRSDRPLKPSHSSTARISTSQPSPNAVAANDRPMVMTFFRRRAV